MVTSRTKVKVILLSQEKREANTFLHMILDADGIK